MSSWIPRILTFFLLGFLIAQNAFAQNGDFDISLRAKVHVPRSQQRSVAKLAEYLTKDEYSDLDKAFSIYCWVVHHINYDIRAAQKVKTQSYSPKQTLRRKKGLCYQFSALYSALCEAAHIPTKEIIGYTLGGHHYDKETFFEADHTWNGVKIDNKWLLVDATWGSGKTVPKKQPIKKFMSYLLKKPFIPSKFKFEKRPSTRFFMVDPESMISNHLPADPVWQLVPKPITMGEFENEHWHTYTNVLDSTINMKLSSEDYTEKISVYESDSYNHFLAKTGEAAKDFNPKNVMITADANLRFGLEYAKTDVKTKDSELKLREQALDHFKKSEKDAKQHIKRANSETTKSILRTSRDFENAIVVPLQKRSSYLSKKMGTRKADLLKIEDGLVKALGQEFRAQERLKDLAYTPFKKRKRSQKLTAVQVAVKHAQFDTMLLRLRRHNDTSTLLLDSIDRHIAFRNSIYARFPDLWEKVELLLDENTFLIANRARFITLTTQIGRIDSTWRAINLVISDLRSNLDSIKELRKIWSKNNVAYTRLLKKTNSTLSYLYANSLSKMDFEDANRQVFTTREKYYQDAVIQADLRIKLGESVLEGFLENTMVYYAVKKANNRTIKYAQEFVKKRISEMNFKRKRSIYQAQRTATLANNMTKKMAIEINKLKRAN